ncbi:MULTISPECIES: ketopantoate reductase family protein [Bacillaceae]|uniref:ketopantoate reductase family protein n=1 Tax=Bacillaceae TaxID=186817 RepID=UPI000BFE16DD|nr:MULTISPECIES: ketopantoate reductase family protein [Bacillaceae]PGT81743.1 2-dehydropantoate 2-reductase [Bacillus sp. AFS040349]UGB32491.1 ketopantoate reductase family protein [Metabacillus sp. B2-18]
MKVLVVGAGAVGGYFGGRLHEKGVDVTFLVREGRQKQLKEKGLKIESIHGNYTFQPKTVLTMESEIEVYDVILIGTKSYHFNQAIQDIKPFVGTQTTIIPMLNGIKHLYELQTMFAKEQIIGGLCFVESTVNEEGTIIQTSTSHELVYGELSGEETERIMKIEEVFSHTKASIRRSNTILQDMWHKYMFITGLSGVTSLFRSSIGPILKTEHGLEIIEGLFAEIGFIMRKMNAPIVDGIEEVQVNRVKEMDYTMKSSMQRDMEKGFQVEANHLQGYLLSEAEKHKVKTPYLKIVYANLETYGKQ